MSFKPGDRVAYLNLGYINLGTVRSVADGRYRVEWDDGFDEDPDLALGEGGVYSAGKLVEVR